jgi:lipopolysaccharide export system protein LptA
MISLSLSVLLLLPALPVLAEQTAPVFSADQPIEITSRRLEAWQDERKSVFTGDVVAKQGNMTLQADSLTVLFAAEQNEIEKLDAVGGVRLHQLERTATADRAVYRRQTGTLVLTGDAVVEQGGNRIAGEEITLFVEENRSLVKGSKQQRVKAFIVPNKVQEEQ